MNKKRCLSIVTNKIPDTSVFFDPYVYISIVSYFLINLINGLDIIIDTEFLNGCFDEDL